MTWPGREVIAETIWRKNQPGIVADYDWDEEKIRFPEGAQEYLDMADAVLALLAEPIRARDSELARVALKRDQYEQALYQSGVPSKDGEPDLPGIPECLVTFKAANTYLLGERDQHYARGEAAGRERAAKWHDGQATWWESEWEGGSRFPARAADHRNWAAAIRALPVGEET